MHSSVLHFLKSNLALPEVAGKDILEVGSRNVNGSPRLAILPLRPSLYVGTDIEAGPDVDIVARAEELTSFFGTDRFDIVVSTELLEHVENWKSVVSQMKKVLRPGGLLLVTTRSPGFHYHSYPSDFWRYTLEDFRRIFSDMDILVLREDTQAPGVFLKSRKPLNFHETILSKIEVMPMEKPKEHDPQSPS